MPCSDSRTDEPYRGPSVIHVSSNNAELKKRLDVATRLLCEVLSAIEAKDTDLLNHISGPELRAWWKDHEKDDATRVEKTAKSFPTITAGAMRAARRICIEQGREDAPEFIIEAIASTIDRVTGLPELLTALKQIEERCDRPSEVHTIANAVLRAT